MNKLEYMQLVAGLLNEYPWLHRVFDGAKYSYNILVITKTERDAQAIQRVFDKLDDQFCVRVRCVNNNLEGFVVDVLVVEPRVYRTINTEKLEMLDRITVRRPHNKSFK